MLSRELALAVGLAALLPLSGCGERSGPASSSAAVSQYAGTEPALPLSFQHPAAWRVSEQAGTIDTFQQVRLLGPRNAEDTYTATIVVRASPLDASGSTQEAVAVFLRGYLAHLPEGAVVESKETVGVAGLAAASVTVSATIPSLSHHDGVRIPVRTRTVVLGHPPSLYELVYTADAGDFDRHAGQFEALLTSLQFLADPAS